MRSGRAAWIVAIALAVVFAGTLDEVRGPSVPKATTAKDFSAASAYAALREVLGGDTPHPFGTAANAAVRDRIIGHLRALGYLVQIQQGFACDAYNTCGDVTNIIARRPGDPARPGIVVAAHYDSVPAGPGASDDGQGVATILEIARVIRQDTFRNPPILLIDDGEEAGLLGAEAFVADPGLKKSTAAVINVEARGTNGPSSLFETSRRNRWLVSTVMPVMPRPATSSLFATIYDMLPNDTDLTVFKRVGIQGVNFGVIGNVAAYHSPLDNLANADLHSIQHHGINVLAILRKLGNTEIGSSEHNAVWFDVMSRFVVRWPERATIPIAIVSLLALLTGIMLLRREERARIGEIAAGAGAFIASIAATAALAFIVSWLGRLRADHAVWVAHPAAMVAAMWIIGAIATFTVFGAFGNRVRAEPLQLGCAVVWNIVAIAIAAALPGVSFLFVAPGVVMSLWALLHGFGVGFRGDVAIAAAVAAIIFFPLGFLLHDALGAPSLLPIAIFLALVTSTFAAMLPRPGPGVTIAGAVAIVACIAVSLALPPYDATNPRRINVSYVTDTQSARWVVNRATPQLQVAAPFHPDAEVFPWARTPVQSAPAPASALPLVQVAGIRKDTYIKFTLHSERGAQRVAIYFTGEPTQIQVNGVTPPPQTRAIRTAGGWNRAVVRGGDAVIEVKMAKGTPVTYVAADYTYDSPPSAAPLIAARSASTAVRSDDGDMTITLQRGRI